MVRFEKKYVSHKKELTPLKCCMCCIKCIHLLSFRIRLDLDCDGRKSLQ
jgi:hypothetical protein